MFLDVVAECGAEAGFLLRPGVGGDGEGVGGLAGHAEQAGLQLAPTSSLVLPARASSKSWMAAAPFSATALSNPW